MTHKPYEPGAAGAIYQSLVLKLVLVKKVIILPLGLVFAIIVNVNRSDVSQLSLFFGTFILDGCDLITI